MSRAHSASAWVWRFGRRHHLAVALGLLVAIPSLVSCDRGYGEGGPDKKDGSSAATKRDERDGDASPQRLISEEDRKVIWEAEHRVNVLKKFGVPQLQSALARRDAGMLRALFPEDFKGSIPRGGPAAEAATSAFSVRAWRAADGKQEPVAADAFVAWLLKRTEPTGEAGPVVDSHVITLSPDDADEPGGSWSGTGKLEIRDAGNGPQGKGGLAETVIYFSMNLAALTEERLSRPGWISSLSVTQVREGTAPRALMRDVANERGFLTAPLWDNWKLPREQRIANTGGVYLNDFNRDGLHDIFVTDTKRSYFYVGQPDGTVREEARDLEIRGDLGGGFAAFVDVDGDGWEDLIHGVAHHPKGYRIYQNLQGHFFKDVTESSNLPQLLFGATGGNATAKSLQEMQVKPTGISIADYDLDGKVDLYVTRGAGGSFKSGSWIDGKAGKVSHNQLLRNQGRGMFEDVTNGAPLDGGNRSTSNAVWLHANEDLRPDLYVVDEFGDGILLLNNANGSFTAAELNDRPTDFGSMGLTSGDVDNDGHPDLYVAEMYSKAGERVMANIPKGTYSDEVTRKLERLVDGSQMYLGLGQGKFRAVGKAMGVHAVGWAWGPCLADLDNDGWLDLYATAGFISQSRDKPDG